MTCGTTLATQRLHGFAALTVCHVLLTGATPTCADVQTGTTPCTYFVDTPSEAV